MMGDGGGMGVEYGEKGDSKQWWRRERERERKGELARREEEEEAEAEEEEELNVDYGGSAKDDGMRPKGNSAGHAGENVGEAWGILQSIYSGLQGH